jgi:hypothetical protein
MVRVLLVIALGVGLVGLVGCGEAERPHEVPVRKGLPAKDAGAAGTSATALPPRAIPTH